MHLPRSMLKHEPAIVEVPPGALVGAVDDAFFRWVTDLGVTGPNQGKGGKYVFVGPDYTWKTSKRLLLSSRLPPTETGCSFVQLLKMVMWKLPRWVLEHSFVFIPFRSWITHQKEKWLMLQVQRSIPFMRTMLRYYDELNAVIQYEPADAFDPELVGQFASIGIKKGKPFAPDARMKKILTEGVAIANATARSLTFRPREERLYFYPGKRQWYSPFTGGSSEFMNNGERVLDDRIIFHYYATGITPAMARAKVGTGSAYEIGAHDSEGQLSRRK